VERQFEVVERQTQVAERRSGPFRLNLTTVFNYYNFEVWGLNLRKFWKLMFVQMLFWIYFYAYMNV